MQKIKISNFIKRCKELYNNSYEYDNISFTNIKDIITLHCKVHGNFKQSVNSHLRGAGCPNCFIYVKNITNEKWLALFKKSHGDTYDYSNNKNFKNKINIFCKKHNLSFSCTARNHYAGTICVECRKEINVDNFFKKCKMIHNNKYDYSKSIYISSNDLLKVICKKHGEFLQKAYIHARGKGCYKCGNSYSLKENLWLDSLKIPAEYRNYKLPNMKYIVDGFDPITNTVYEFMGDYWHGNPNKYNANDVNKNNNKKFGYLYAQTILRKDNIEKLYKFIMIWESDFKISSNEYKKLLKDK